MSGLEQYPRDEQGRLVLPPATLARFWHKVDKRGSDECWEWQGTRSWNNYGMFGIRRTMTPAHRISYATSIHSPDASVEIHHTCHNRACVNPSHLCEVTPSENSMHRVAWPNKDQPLRPPDYKPRRGRGQLPTIDRFMEKVQQPANHDECWPWLGSRGPLGYGNFGVDGRTVKAHRFSYEHFIGPIPDGLLVRHTCHNPSCVNPAHLLSGTNRDNTQDMLKAGRQPNMKGRDLVPPDRRARGDRHMSRTKPEALKRGSDHWKAKITEGDVREIFRLKASGATAAAIARRYGLTDVNVTAILHRKTWRHVDVAPLPPEALTYDGRGESHPQAKLTPSQVREIRSRAALGARHAELAPDYGISAKTVGGIVRRERWKHID